MKKTGLFLVLGIFILFSIMQSGCSGGGQAASGNTPTGNIVSGVASKGLISGGTVTVYAVDGGAADTELAAGITDASGNYALDIGDYTGPILVEVTGGTYTDEATGSTVSNSSLRAVLPAVTGDVRVAVTPLTEIAVQLAGDSLTATGISAANTAASTLLNGADITATMPPDINGDLSGASTDEVNYCMLLSAISQMIEDGSATDIGAATQKLSSDLEDDGKLANGDTGAGFLLQTALGNFIASGENHTGLTENDITLDDTLVDATRKFLLTKIEYEYDGDNVIDEVTAYGYDGNGRRIMTAFDGDWGDDIVPDGVADARIFTTYDEYGNVLKTEKDANGDGLIDSSTSNTYDANGDQTLQEVDSNNDGVVDQRITWTRIELGTRTRVIKTWDNDLDGISDEYTDYTYDEYDNLIKEQGTETLHENITYTWQNAEASPVLFSGSDGANGNELWVTDGTEAGTHMVKDIDQSAHGAYPGGIYCTG